VTYTTEVQAALRTAGILIDPPEPPEPTVPAGHLRYLVAVGTTATEGVAPPVEVAAILRAVATQIEGA
jgi:hypothetical protein